MAVRVRAGVSALAMARAGYSRPAGGGAASVYAVKVGPDGTKRWDKVHTPGAAAYSLGATPDGTIGCGQTGTPVLGCTANRSCGYCVRYGLDGTIAWEQAYEPAGGDIQQFYGLAIDSTRFVIVGNTTDTDSWLDPLAREFDLTGNPGFSTVFSQYREDAVVSVRAAADGSYWAAGYTGTWTSCQQPYVVHFSANGTLIADGGLGPCNDHASNGFLSAALSVLPMPDGSIVLAGSQYTGVTYNADAFIAKWTHFDTLPREEWREIFGGTGDDMFSDVAPLADGFALVGSTANAGQLGLDGDLYLVKVDVSGFLVWSKRLGGTGDQTGISILKANDGSYLVGGTTTSEGAGGRDLWLLDFPLDCP